MAIQVLNTPSIKNGIKNTLGCISFAGAIVTLYEMAAHSKTTDKTLLQISIILNGIASRPGFAICEWAVHQIATPATLTRIFGQNTIFEVNPWHPRHLFNVSVNLLAAASLLQIIYARKPLFSGTAVLTLFNCLTGRSTLHLANDAWHAAYSLKRG